MAVDQNTTTSWEVVHSVSLCPEHASSLPSLIQIHLFFAHRTQKERVPGTRHERTWDSLQRLPLPQEYTSRVFHLSQHLPSPNTSHRGPCGHSTDTHMDHRKPSTHPLSYQNSQYGLDHT